MRPAWTRPIFQSFLRTLKLKWRMTSSITNTRKAATITRAIIIHLLICDVYAIKYIISEAAPKEAIMQSTKLRTALLPGNPHISAFLRLNMNRPNTKNAAMRTAQRI